MSMFGKILLYMLMLSLLKANAQSSFGLEIQSGFIKPLSKARNPYTFTHGGAGGPSYSIAAVWSDSTSANLNVIFTGGFQYHAMSVWTKEFGRGFSSYDSLSIRSGWLYLGFAPTWSLTSDKRIRLKIGANFIWPLAATASGLKKGTSMTAPYYHSTTIEEQHVPYGKFNMQFVLGLERTFRLDPLYAVRIGPTVGLGITNESAMVFNVRTLHALVSVQFLRTRSTKPRSTTN